MLSSLLIANRGEIACRIIRTCRRLGIRTVAVYSEADSSALFVKQADEAVLLGPAPAAESYLRGDLIIAAALEHGAQAIHPGYGFLSENAAFASAVRDAGLVFVGPAPETIKNMGSKSDAKRLMENAGVPIVPGYHGVAQSKKTLFTEAHVIGFPLMIKAAAGGGGKGMRVVHSEAEFIDALDAARREAKKSFGDDAMILERYLEQPRHIEVQIFGDHHGNYVHLFERDCSTQRRYQKVVEEAPAHGLSDDQRQAMADAAVAAARAVDYSGAGTIEFIVDREGSFYFMEMNTRLQVEHPVTELITGQDLVEWQLEVASGNTLPITQDRVSSTGHAIEVRLYAEDPQSGFLPSSGKLDLMQFPEQDSGIRVDTGFATGDTITVFYDPMIAKLAVHADSREQATTAMQAALAATAVIGPLSNTGFLQSVLQHPRWIAGEMDTSFLDAHLDEVMAATPHDDAFELAGVIYELLVQEGEACLRLADSEDPWTPWAIADSWRLGHSGKRVVSLSVKETAGDRLLRFDCHGYNGDYQLGNGSKTRQIKSGKLRGNKLSFVLDDQEYNLMLFAAGDTIQVADPGGRISLRYISPLFTADEEKYAGDQLAAPMPGQLIGFRTSQGQLVSEGDVLVLMEAMKMELSLRAPRDGRIAVLRHEPGDFVEAETVLVEFDPLENDE